MSTLPDILWDQAPPATPSRPPAPPPIQWDDAPAEPPITPDVRPLAAPPRAPDAMNRTVGDFASFFTGEGRAAQKYPEIGTAPQADTMRTGFTFLVEPNEEARAAWLIKEFPGATARKDGRETIVKFPDGKEYSLNRVGPSPQDFAEFLYTIPHVMAAGAGALIGKTATRRALGMGAATGADTAVSQGLSMARGARETVDAGEVLGSAALGAAFGRMGEAAYNTLRHVFRRGATTATGGLTLQARLSIERAGINPDDLTARTIRELEVLLPRARSPAEAVRLAQARSYDVPVTRGDIGQDPKMQAFEARIQKGGTPGELTTPNERRLQALKGEEQPAALREGIAKASERVSGKPLELDPQLGTVATAKGEAFARTQKTLSALYQRDKATVSRLYKRGIDEEASFMPDKVSPLSREAQKIKEGTNVPQAHAIADEIAALIKEATAGGKVPIKFERMELIRQKISELGGASDAATRATGAKLRRAYGEWEKSLEPGDFVKGSPDAVKAIFAGRAKRAEMAAKFEDDPAIRAILKAERMPDGRYKLDLNPGEAADAVLGAGIGKRGATDTAQRMKTVLGENSAAWREFKRELFAKVAEKGAGTLYQKFAAFTRNHRDLARVVFTPDDIREIQTLADVARFATYRQPGIVNYSGSAYEAFRNLRNLDIGSPVKAIEGLLSGALVAPARAMAGNPTPGLALKPLLGPRPPLGVFAAGAAAERESDPAAVAARILRQLPAIPDR